MRMLNFQLLCLLKTFWRTEGKGLCECKGTKCRGTGQQAQYLCVLIQIDCLNFPHCHKRSRTFGLHLYYFYVQHVSIFQHCGLWLVIWAVRWSSAERRWLNGGLDFTASSPQHPPQKQEYWTPGRNGGRFPDSELYSGLTSYSVVCWYLRQSRWDKLPGISTVMSSKVLFSRPE